LRWASYRLSYNLEIVLEAIKKDGVAIKFASDTIVQEVIFKLGYDKMIKLLEQKVESSNKNN
jgi:predicted nucleic acid-binding protein